MPKKIVVTIPIALPTWNRLLAMHRFERMKCRTLIQDIISLSIAIEKDSLTPMEYQLKRQLMDSCIARYYRTIAYPSSKKSGTSKKRRRKTKLS